MTWIATGIMGTGLALNTGGRLGHNKDAQTAGGLLGLLGGVGGTMGGMPAMTGNPGVGMFSAGTATGGAPLTGGVSMIPASADTIGSGGGLAGLLNSPTATALKNGIGITSSLKGLMGEGSTGQPSPPPSPGGFSLMPKPPQPVPQLTNIGSESKPDIAALLRILAGR